MRSAGLDFDAAWLEAVPAALQAATRAERAGWSGVFTSTRAEWEAAYRREGSRTPLGRLFVADQLDGQRSDGRLIC